MTAETVEEKGKRVRKTVSEEASLAEGKGRLTPGRRQKEKTSEGNEGNFITRPIRNFISYLGEVNNELKKVTWPAREDTIRLTRIVLIATIVASFVLGSLAFVADRIVAIGLENEVLFVLLFTTIVIGTIVYMRRGGISSMR